MFDRLHAELNNASDFIARDFITGDFKGSVLPSDPRKLLHIEASLERLSPSSQNIDDRLLSIFRSNHQATIAQSVTLNGNGLHSNAQTEVVLNPAKPGTGIMFRRSDLDTDNLIPARYDRVTSTHLSTKIENDAGVSVDTIEHLMAALYALGLGNLVIDVSGPEIPILDGSSAPFVEAVFRAGLQQQSAVRSRLYIRRLVEARLEDGSYARLLPAKNPDDQDLQLSMDIEYPAEAIGQQTFATVLGPQTFIQLLADSRTFCMLKDVETMRAHGLIKGGSLSNAVVVDGATVLNPEGLRHKDEFVRHKLLDAVGDLSLAQMPIIGSFEGWRAGHGLNNQLLRALFKDPNNYQIR